jgi:hypothetical protein
MIDRIFFAALSFCLMVTGALAIGSSMVGVDRPGDASRADAVPVRIVQLAPVVVTAKRLAPATAIAQTGTGETAAARVE